MVTIETIIMTGNISIMGLLAMPVPMVNIRPIMPIIARTMTIGMSFISRLPGVTLGISGGGWSVTSPPGVRGISRRARRWNRTVLIAENPPTSHVATRAQCRGRRRHVVQFVSHSAARTTGFANSPGVARPQRNSEVEHQVGGIVTHARMGHIDEDATRGIVRAPDLARVTILAKHTQVDMAIPVDVPVALVIPSVVDMVAQHSRSNDFDNEGERFEPAEWVLARIGHPPFSNSLSLGEHGVRDGELLMLESASNTAPTPLFDDIMYNVAIADADHFRGWTPRTARLTGSVLAAITMLVGCLGLLTAPQALPVWVSGSLALAVAILLVVAGMVLSRMYGDADTALVLGGCALPAAFTAGMLYV